MESGPGHPAEETGRQRALKRPGLRQLGLLSLRQLCPLPLRLVRQHHLQALHRQGMSVLRRAVQLQCWVSLTSVRLLWVSQGLLQRLLQRLMQTQTS